MKFLPFVEEIRQKTFEKSPTVNGQYNPRERLLIFSNELLKTTGQRLTGPKIKEMSIEHIKAWVTFFRLGE